jgi:5-methylcytosine-specific restriction endonuclease McrA
MISRAEARALGVKRYFTGKACPSGHIAERMVSNTDCVDCMSVRYVRYRKTDRGRSVLREQKRQQRLLDPQKHRDNALIEYWNCPENGRANSANARARAVGIYEKITGADVKSVIAAQQFECAVCEIPVGYYEIDHRIPLAIGGANNRENLQCLCRVCHRTKTTSERRTQRAAVNV